MDNERSREEKAFWEKAYLSALESLIRTHPNPIAYMGEICQTAEVAANLARHGWNARF